MEDKTSQLVKLADSWIESANKLKEYDDEEKYPGFDGIVLAYRLMEEVALAAMINRDSLKGALLELRDNLE